MVDFLSPEISVAEVRNGPVAFPSVSPGVGAFVGKAERGPINEPIQVFSPDDFEEVFGTYLTDSYLVDSVVAFFQNGGQRCYVTRVAHYTTISNPATLTADEATTMLDTTAGAATAGSDTSSAASFPAYLAAGTVFDGTVDGGAVAGFTIAATVATITGAAATYALGAGGDSVTLSINGVPGSQVIDLSAAAATQAGYLLVLNAALIGAKAVDQAGEIRIITDRKGSGAGGSITAFGGAALAKTGLAVAAFVNAGPNNVADDRAVTAAEFVGLMNVGFPGSTSTAVGTDVVTWESDTTGAASSVAFTSPAAVATLIPGFDLVAHSGAASSGAVNTLLVSASNEGAWGNLYRVTTTKVDSSVAVAAVTAAGATTSLVVSTVQRILVGDTISVTKAGDTQRAVVTAVDPTLKSLELSPSITVPGGGYLGTEPVINETVNIAVIDSDGLTETTYRNMRMSPTAGARYIENVINNTSRSSIAVTDQLVSVVGDNRPANVTSELLGQTQAGSDGSALVDTDYIGAQAGATGLYSLDNFDDFLLLAVPGITTSTVHKGIETYVENRQDLYAILEAPQGLEPAAVVTYVQSTANLASSYEGIYYPWVRAVDPRTSGPASFPNSGYVMGVFARTFQRRNFGKAPAGIDDGQVKNITGVDYEVKKPAYDLLYPASINAIQAKKGKGFVVMGSRTLDPLGDFRQVNMRIVFLVVKRVFKDGTEFVLFENNDETTRARVSRFMTLYLRGLRESGILSGATDNEAFFVKCDADNNTATVRRSGKLKCRIGLNVGNTIEFVEVTLEQDTRAIDAEIAAEVG